MTFVIPVQSYQTGTKGVGGEEEEEEEGEEVGEESGEDIYAPHLGQPLEANLIVLLIAGVLRSALFTLFFMQLRHYLLVH